MAVDTKFVNNLKDMALKTLLNFLIQTLHHSFNVFDEPEGFIH